MSASALPPPSKQQKIHDGPASGAVNIAVASTSQAAYQVCYTVLLSCVLTIRLAVYSPVDRHFCYE